MRCQIIESALALGETKGSYTDKNEFIRRESRISKDKVDI